MNAMAREAGRAIFTWLRERDEEKMIRSFDENLVPRFSIEVLKLHVDEGSKHRHTIAHDLVKHGKFQVLTHLVMQFGWDLNEQRASDGNTPLHLALWQDQGDAAQLLLKMGADTKIKNMYGEDAKDVQAKQKPFRARLQGAVTAIEVLTVVEQGLACFDRTDVVTAYFELAKRSVDYDVKFCTWKAHSDRLEFGTNSFRKLTQACTEVLCRSDDSDLAARHWATKLRALAMLPDQNIMRDMELWVQKKGLPLDTWSAKVLQEVAWGLAKIQGGGRLWELCYEELGNKLSQHVPVLPERNLGSIVWAFAKAGRRPGDRALLKHRVLFQAVANHLETNGAALTCVETVSVIAWAFARMQEHHPRAFEEVAVSVKRLATTFQDQSVANTLWGFAKLGLAEEQLFSALMHRADSTLYVVTDRGHEKLLEQDKLRCWCQVYQAYCCCCTRCPSTIAALSRRLASDLQKISKQDREDGLSSGSGLESADSLRQLDAMLAEMSDVGDDASHREPQGLPAGSLEADPRSVPSPQVTEQNAARANAVFESSVAAQLPIKIVVLKFSRSPEAFRQALMEGPQLEACRQALKDAGFEVKLSSGAKAFVRPEHYSAMCEAIHSTGKPLFTSHVLVAEEFECLLYEVFSNLPSAQGVRCRDREDLAGSWDRMSAELKLTVKRTFFEIRIPPSLYSGTGISRTRSA